MNQTSVTIPPRLLRFLKEKAEREERSLSNVIIVILKEYAEAEE